MNFLDSLTPTLIWLPEKGIGYYPVTAQPYDANYWENYRRLDDSEMGAKLTEKRIQYVRNVYGHTSFTNGLPVALVDIGIGGGRFCREADCYGSDINPVAERWLRDNGRLWDGVSRVTVMTFWDSLEHIHDPSSLLALTDWVFVSMPIYEDVAHVLRSKHFKKDEHCWYFTEQGLSLFMKLHGFTLVNVDWFETFEGRDGIGSFAFRRSA